MSDINKEQQITRLQDNLLVIRKIAGWTADELGSRIGVTKQTISNLENRKSPMTLTQYIAIRAILDYEIASNPENTTLAQVVNILLDQEQPDSEKDAKKSKEAIETIAAAAAGGASAAAISAISATLLGPLAFTPILGAAVAGGSVWMSKLIKNNKK